MLRIYFYCGEFKMRKATVFASGNVGMSTESSSETSKTQHAKINVVF